MRRRCFQYPRSLVNLGSGGRVSWASGWSRRRPSCTVGCPCPSLRSRSGAFRAPARVGCAGDAGRAAKAAPPAHLQMQPRQLPSVQRAAAATGCLDKLPQRAGSAAQRSRWRGRAPPRQGRRAALPGRASRAPPRQGYEKLHKVWGPVAPGVESRRGDRSHHTRPGRGGRGKGNKKVNLHPHSRLSLGEAA